MSDASNLLSILRGEVPVPPLSSPPSSSSPLSPLSRPGLVSPPPTRDAPATTQDTDHLNQLLSRLSSTRHVPSAPSPSTVPSPPTRSPSSSLLSILQGGRTGPPATAAATPPPPPNFSFVSPFDLLSSAASQPAPSAPRATQEKLSPPPTKEQPSPAPASNRIAQPIPTTFLSYPALPQNAAPTAPSTPSPVHEGLRIPSSSLPADISTPQTLSISCEAKTHADSLASTRPILVPITLFSPQLPEEPKLGAYRRLTISATGIAYAVQASLKKSSKPTPAGESVRIIDRDSGARFVIADPFAGQAIDVSHLEFSKLGHGGTRALLIVGAKAGVVSVYHGRDGFEKGEQKQSIFESRLVWTHESIVLAKLHPLYLTCSIVAVVTRAPGANAVHLIDLDRWTQSRMSMSDDCPGRTEFKFDEIVRDVAFSPDGSLFAVLGSSRYWIYPTPTSGDASPLESLVSAPLPRSIAESTPAEIVFVTGSPSKSPEPSPFKASTVRGVAVSSANGTRVDLLSFYPSSSTAPAVSIKLEPPSGLPVGSETAHSAQLAFDPSVSTLYVSSTLRGSIFAFKVSCSSWSPSATTRNDRQDNEAQVDRDVSSLRRLLAEETSVNNNKSRSIRISHVLETPHPEPVLQFVLDAASSASPPAQSSSPSGGALVLHSQGIQHMTLATLPASSSTSKRGSLSAPALSPGKPTLSNPFSSTRPTPPPTNGVVVIAPGDASRVSPLSSVPSSPPTESELDKYLASGRRMSLEGSIHVQSEVEVEEERVDEVSWEFMRRASIPIVDVGSPENENGVVVDAERDDDDKKKDREVEEVLRAKRQQDKVGAAPPPQQNNCDELGSIDEPVRGDIANASVLDPAAVSLNLADKRDQPASQAVVGNVQRDGNEPDEVRRAVPLVRAAIKSMKQKAKAAERNGEGTFSNTYKNYSTTSPPVAASSADSSSAFALPPQTPTTPLAQSPRFSNVAVGDNVVDELRKMERSIEAIVSRQLETYLDRFEEERSSDQARNTARQETLLKLVSQSVVKGTGRALEVALNETLLPAIEDAVGAEIDKSLETSVRKILPREISSVVLDPDFTRTLAGSIVPTVEKTVAQLVLTGLVPSFKHTLHKSVDEIMHEMRGEMVGVRKEIVREQSGAVDKLEQEVGGLKRQVGELKATLERMEKLMLANAQAQSTPARPLPAPVAPPPASTPSLGSMSAFSPRSSSKPETLPPIPRNETPSTSYEDTLTTFLQPSESPSFPSLVYFVNSSPPARLDRIFPPPSATTAGGQPGPAISMAVALSLAFRLSELIESKEGRLGSDERVQLEWLKRAVGACNGQQPPDVLALIPRILDSVLDHLVSRGRKLMALSDHRGAGEIRIVEQYARARLSMFA